VRNLARTILVLLFGVLFVLWWWLTRPRSQHYDPVADTWRD